MTKPVDVLVKFKEGTSAEGRGKVKHFHKALGVHLMEPHQGKSLETFMQELKDSPDVEFVEPNMPAFPAALTNDPYVGYEWHLSKIGVPTAWLTTKGSPSVVVSIIDTGVTAVADLAANMVPGFSVFDNTTNTADVSGHGTTVAGTVAAIGNNAKAVVGVAYLTKIMPIRICNASQGLDWNKIAQAITYSADHGVKVANCSWESVPPLWTSSTIKSAVAYLRGKGGVMVVASGNGGVNLGSTVAPAGWLVVGGTDKNDVVTTFSNYGAAVAVVAPAVSIATTGMAGDVRLCTGTSYAAPIVAATAALMLAVKPTLTPDQIVSKIKSTAHLGRVDVAAAVASAQL